MCTGLTDELVNNFDASETSMIDTELNKLNIDIAALQETHLAMDGSLREKYYTFFWQGNAP